MCVATYINLDKNVSGDNHLIVEVNETFMSAYSIAYNVSNIRDIQFNPWKLLESTKTYQEYLLGLPVSVYRFEFLMAAAGVPEAGDPSYHGWAIRGLPGAKYHAMNGQMENSNLVRQQRAAGRNFREYVVLQHPDYYRFALMR